MHEEFDLAWIVRENLEFDEKLPLLAHEVLKRRIKYEVLDCAVDASDEEFGSTIEQMVDVLIDNLDSFSDMTTPEIEYAVIHLHIACGISECLNQGEAPREKVFWKKS